MSIAEDLYFGCPVQHTRQFIAGKWQMAILWNLRNETLCFSALKTKLPGISDKIFIQELNFFVEKNIIQRNIFDFPSTKTTYTLTSLGISLIPIIISIVEWGYLNLQDKSISKEMFMTPLSSIEAIERMMAENA